MRNAMIATVAALAVGLSGCASQDYVAQNYKGVDYVAYHDAPSKQDFYVYDKPGESRMMMTLEVGGSLMLLVTGANAVPPQTIYEQAADRWLAAQGRACHSTRSTLILMSEYEVTYDCAVDTQEPQKPAPVASATGL